MKKILVTSITVLSELYYLSKWFACSKLADMFHYSAFDLKLRLDEAAHNDRGVSIFIVRLFHNKLLGTGIDLYTELIHYVDTIFIISLLSPIGVFGLVCGLYYLQQKYSWRHLLGVMIVLLVFPFLETIGVLHVPFPVKLVLLSLPFQIVSLYGMWQFMSVPKNGLIRLATVGIFLLVTLLWIAAFPQGFAPFCFLK